MRGGVQREGWRGRERVCVGMSMCERERESKSEKEIELMCYCKQHAHHYFDVVNTTSVFLLVPLRVYPCQLKS